MRTREQDPDGTLILYFDDDFRPATPFTATLIKMIKPCGKVVFAVQQGGVESRPSPDGQRCSVSRAHPSLVSES